MVQINTDTYTPVKKSEQNIANLSFDQEYQMSAVIPAGYDGKGLQRTTADALAMKITEDTPDTYIAIAAPGTQQSEAKWQVKKITVSGADTIFTWADGDAEFDNVATDLTALTYS